MAWTRTILSLLLLTGLSIRLAATSHAWQFLVAAGVAVAIAVIQAWGHHAKYRRSNSGILHDRVRPNTRSVFTLTATVVGLGLASLAVVVTV